MVTCWDCLRTLPYDCVCPVSDKTKSLRWAEKSIREAELFVAILEGFKPTIEVNGKSYVVNPKIIDVGGIELCVETDVKEDADMNLVLLDKNGLSLFQRYRSKEELVGVVAVNISWRIGAVSSEA